MKLFLINIWRQFFSCLQSFSTLSNINIAIAFHFLRFRLFRRTKFSTLFCSSQNMLFRNVLLLYFNSRHFIFGILILCVIFRFKEIVKKNFFICICVLAVFPFWDMSYRVLFLLHLDIVPCNLLFFGEIDMVISTAQ